MGTGFRGTFVISWAQTEIDGVQDAPLPALQVGAAWSWSGDPVRVDGPASVLPLGEMTADTLDIRPRAARMVRRLVGAALAQERPGKSQEALAESTQGESSFVVTDGRKGYTVTLIAVGRGVPPLLMFLDELPPSGVDLWVVHHRHSADVPQAPQDPGGVICFTPQTRILTPGGAVPVGLLREGDLVQTKDSGAQPICWIGSRRMSGARLFAMPALRPIRLRAGALGLGQPNRDVLVSPDHRMVVRGAAARALFNTPEVLVAARDLIDGQSIVQDLDVKEVTYVHLLLPRHEVLFADGVETESFHPANTAMSSLDAEDRTRLLRTLPGVAGNPQGYGAYARRNLSASEAAILRHEAA
ncbi:Hint domain-containing protein [Mameliella alba]|nr:Hint domain-containing protein [Mameliella alba]MBY6168084.1 Hint domain-containing protein [Mameliella alba]MBY6173105.1 Hint domain-containing protein [Mameliella alba]